MILGPTIAVTATLSAFTVLGVVRERLKARLTAQSRALERTIEHLEHLYPDCPISQSMRDSLVSVSQTTEEAVEQMNRINSALKELRSPPPEGDFVERGIVRLFAGTYRRLDAEMARNAPAPAPRPLRDERLGPAERKARTNPPHYGRFHGDKTHS